MSGGHWDYNFIRVQNEVGRVGEDPEVQARFPRLAARLRQLAESLYAVMHDLDWDFSGDTEIQDDRAFEEDALEKLRREK
jgi:hypothetical protein